jgi:hypothetical protein
MAQLFKQGKISFYGVFELFVNVFIEMMLQQKFCKIRQVLILMGNSIGFIKSQGQKLILKVNGI